MATLARLHAALDSITETEHVIAAIHSTSPHPPQALSRVGSLLGETRELLRWMLARPEHRQAVGSAKQAVGSANTLAHAKRQV